jgi:hypothetical protein
MGMFTVYSGMDKFTVYSGMDMFTVYSRLDMFIVYSGMDMFTVYSGMEIFAIYSGMGMFTVYSGMDKFTVYSGMDMFSLQWGGYLKCIHVHRFFSPSHLLCGITAHRQRTRLFSCSPGFESDISSAFGGRGLGVPRDEVLLDREEMTSL